jgi:uncharacterized membrane protein YfcA
MNLPDISHLADALADRRFALAAAVAALAGLVRGFSGFGSALIYIPLMAALYSPRIAAVTIVLIDFAGAAPLSLREFPKCDWRDVLPMAMATAGAIPFGAMALVLVDPVALRWFVAFLILILLVPLALGWRYHGEPKLPLTIGVGLFAGFGAGSVQIAAPPLVLYWLGATRHVATVRANFMVFLLLTDILGVLVYGWKGLLTPDGIALAVLLAAPFFIAMACGAYCFHGTSDTLYRRIAYAIIGFTAFFSLPLFDGILR